MQRCMHEQMEAAAAAASATKAWPGARRRRAERSPPPQSASICSLSTFSPSSTCGLLLCPGPSLSRFFSPDTISSMRSSRVAASMDVLMVCTLTCTRGTAGGAREEVDGREGVRAWVGGAWWPRACDGWLVGWRGERRPGPSRPAAGASAEVQGGGCRQKGVPGLDACLPASSHLVRLPHPQLLHVDDLPAVACRQAHTGQQAAGVEVGVRCSSVGWGGCPR